MNTALMIARGNVLPRTEAVRRALQNGLDAAAAADWLFLESWEAAPTGEVGAVLRVAQIRRANRALADAIRDELRTSAQPRSCADAPKQPPR